MPPEQQDAMPHEPPDFMTARAGPLLLTLSNTVCTLKYSLSRHSFNPSLIRSCSNSETIVSKDFTSSPSLNSSFDWVTLSLCEAEALVIVVEHAAATAVAPGTAIAEPGLAVWEEALVAEVDGLPTIPVPDPEVLCTLVLLLTTSCRTLCRARQSSSALWEDSVELGQYSRSRDSSLYSPREGSSERRAGRESEKPQML